MLLFAYCAMIHPLCILNNKQYNIGRDVKFKPIHSATVPGLLLVPTASIPIIIQHLLAMPETVDAHAQCAVSADHDGRAADAHARLCAGP